MWPFCVYKHNHTREGLKLNNLFFVLCDFCWFDFFGWMSAISGFLFTPFDFIVPVLLPAIFNWV